MLVWFSGIPESEQTLNNLSAILQLKKKSIRSNTRETPDWSSILFQVRKLCNSMSQAVPSMAL